MTKRYKITISYDGTKYSGWQIQPNATTIQQLIENALEILLKERTPLTGSGRTDAGVHAVAQIAHFDAPKELILPPFLRSLNGILPNDIRIKEIELAADNFHARYSAKKKTYHYVLSCKPVQDPFQRLYSHHISHKIDLDLLKEASQLFVGRHNFTSFANEPCKGSVAKNPFRTINHINMIEESCGVVRLEFEGEGFLYKMVRNIVGTLLDIASGKKSINDIPDIFAKQDRRLAGRAAPALGLFLVSVEYPNDQDSP